MKTYIYIYIYSLRDVLNMAMKRKREMNTYNLSIQKRRALQRLKENVSIIVLPSDKGRPAVVMNKSDYEVKPINKNKLSKIKKVFLKKTIF